MANITALKGVRTRFRKNLSREVGAAKTLISGDYKVSDIIDGIWHVTMGTGMGLQHSCELTGWIFYNAIEKEFNTNAHVVNRHRIWQQCMFRYDIIVRVGDRQKAKIVVWE